MSAPKLLRARRAPSPPSPPLRPPRATAALEIAAASVCFFWELAVALSLIAGISGDADSARAACSATDPARTPSAVMTRPGKLFRDFFFLLSQLPRPIR